MDEAFLHAEIPRNSNPQGTGQNGRYRRHVRVGFTRTTLQEVFVFVLVREEICRQPCVHELRRQKLGGGGSHHIHVLIW